MQNISLLLVASVALAAQGVPGHYIVEFQTEPEATVAAAKKMRLSMADRDVLARRAQIRAEHARSEDAIRGLGGAVSHHYTTVLNGMAVQIPDSAVAQMRVLPGVIGVYPVKSWHPVLDHAVRVHRIPDAWAAIRGGQGSAGAGVKIGILDAGIDVTHPGFQGFSTAIPSGFPIGCAYTSDTAGNLGDCVSSKIELGNTNSKVIVSRDYTGEGGADTGGHGTGVAMIAAGLTNNATYDVLLSDGATYLPVPIGPITGVAPGAWLGNYKVCGVNGCLTSWFLKALEDAIHDGMTALNYSVGGPVLNSSSENGVEPRAISNAVAAGVAVVVAAGDDGSTPDGIQAPSTIDEPALAADAIAVGAIGNERIFGYAVILGDLAPMQALLPDTSNDSNSPNLQDPVKGALTDVAGIDGNGFACGALTAGSLSGQVALIQRSIKGSAGACTFDVKLNNAMRAGAVAAVVYNSVPDELFHMTLTTASLPSMFVTLADGQTLKSQITANPGTQVYLDFGGATGFPISADLIAAYSPAGPTPGGNIKPDLVAVGGYDAGTGDEVLTADVSGFEPDPYQIAAGTSFSAPFVTGSMAVLMGARPGLTVKQYKSLLVNSAPQLNVCADASVPLAGVCADGASPAPAPIMVAGSGKLDLLGAMQNNLAATPTAVNFQTASGTVNASQPVVVTNVGPVTDTFTVTIQSLDGGISPAVDTATFTLAPGVSRTINVSLSGSNLSAGTLDDGYVVITGTKSPTATRLAYWFGVPGTTVRRISVLNQNELNGGAPARSQLSILVRYTDAIGLPINGPAPTVTTPGTRARVLKISPLGDIPGSFQIDVQLDSGLALGYDEFDITVSGLPPLKVFIPIV